MPSQVQRKFILGSKWVYYKIYCGPGTTDSVLTKAILPVVHQLKMEEVVEKWFFIRYSDPSHHLRVRFLMKDSSHIFKVVNSVYSELGAFLNQDLIKKVQLDTYQREMERYGENTINLSESLFCLSSESILNFLGLIEGDEGERLRWLFGLRAIDNLLNAFNYELEEKASLLEELKTDFGVEFGMSRPLKKQLDSKYRREKKSIENFFELDRKIKNDYYPILKILSDEREKLEKIAQQILFMAESERLKISINSLLGSYIHMLMNRLFKSKNRLNEMVSYDFLFRYYRSKMARTKNSNVITSTHTTLIESKISAL
ncbi:thiopeptide-type bacteriocin biosynthesis protein [Maribacter sp. 2307UL18-2]|uniref:thiopeptide-type bacteriocin biosynthesis protein n=1 Tax=Maribacter sp. 2307UL18-2 TaxID=3386274 RepID=UPI0039BC6062